MCKKKLCNVLSCVLASESGQGCASHTEGCNGATGIEFSFYVFRSIIIIVVRSSMMFDSFLSLSALKINFLKNCFSNSTDVPFNFFLFKL